MDPDPLTRLHRPEPPLPDVEPDPVPPDENDDLPPDLPEPYRHPEGDPPEHRPPEREPPGRKPPVRAPPASACRPSACAGIFTSTGSERDMRMPGCHFPEDSDETESKLVRDRLRDRRRVRPGRV